HTCPGRERRRWALPSAICWASVTRRGTWIRSPTSYSRRAPTAGGRHRWGGCGAARMERTLLPHPQRQWLQRRNNACNSRGGVGPSPPALCLPSLPLALVARTHRVVYFLCFCLSHLGSAPLRPEIADNMWTVHETRPPVHQPARAYDHADKAVRGSVPA